jgi:heat-inducible transcriptional repressor
MLDERKTAILRAVVQEYIATGQPVGSSHVAHAPGVSVSSATVRNEMAVLEQEGYLHQPHTSAGRVPTDKGYRFFVDHLAQPGRLDAARTQQVRQFFDHAHGALEQMLHDTSRLLSGLTNYAALVVGPGHEAAVFRSVQLVSLSSRVVMLVAVLSNGTVENEPIDLGEGGDDVTEARVAAASAHLAHHLVGNSLATVPVVPATGDASTDALCDAALGTLRDLVSRNDEHVFVGGAARMAAAFDAVEVVRGVLTTLEQQYVVVTLLRDVLDRGLSVAIGSSEHGIEPLAACSLVVAPYVVEGEPAGTIGVLGPTRMNYPEALAAVDLVSERLGRRLSEG